MRAFHYLRFAISVILCVGCAATTQVEQRAGLFGHLSSSALDVRSLADAHITATIRNYGPTNATINMLDAANGILMLKVLDSSGQEVPPVPPSLPAPDRHSHDRHLSPGESVTFVYTLNHFIVETPPGLYRVRMKGMPSDELTLR